MTSLHSKPLALKNVTVTDSFWRTEQELVRTAVIPYQWNALNDNVPGAAPSYCMHNFKAAAAQNKRKDTQGNAFVPPKYIGTSLSNRHMSQPSDLPGTAGMAWPNAVLSASRCSAVVGTETCV